MATAGAMALAMPVVAGVLTASRLRTQASAAQSPAVPQWQIATGGKLAFDVAPVKVDKSGSDRGFHDYPQIVRIDRDDWLAAYAPFWPRPGQV